MMPVSGFVLFLGLAVAFFYLSLVLLLAGAGGRAAKGAQSVRFVSSRSAAFALTVIGVQKLPRIDGRWKASLARRREQEAPGRTRSEQTGDPDGLRERGRARAVVTAAASVAELVDQFDAIGATRSRSAS
jgi:hypothetical protein